MADTCHGPRRAQSEYPSRVSVVSCGLPRGLAMTESLARAELYFFAELGAAVVRAPGRGAGDDAAAGVLLDLAFISVLQASRRERERAVGVRRSRTLWRVPRCAGVGVLTTMALELPFTFFLSVFFSSTLN